MQFKNYRDLLPQIDPQVFKDQEVTIDHITPGMVFQDNYEAPSGWSTDWVYVLAVRKRKGGGRIFYVRNKDGKEYKLHYNAGEKVLPRPDKRAAFE